MRQLVRLTRFNVTFRALMLAAFLILAGKSPAQAGYYSIAKHTGSGSLNNYPLVKSEYDPFEAGDSPIMDGTYTFTDHYEFEWVPDNGDINADPPVDTTMIATADVWWGPAPSGVWEQEISSSASASSGEESLSSSWYNTIDGQGGGQIFSGNYGGVISKVFRLTGASPTAEVTWTLSQVHQGIDPLLGIPYYSYAQLTRRPVSQKYVWFTYPLKPPHNTIDVPFNQNQAAVTFHGGWRYYPGLTGSYRVDLQVKYNAAQVQWADLTPAGGVAGPVMQWTQQHSISTNQQQTMIKATLKHNPLGTGYVVVPNNNPGSNLQLVTDAIAIWVD